MTDLSDQDLINRVRGLVRRGNENTAALLQHLGEVDRRKLYAAAACSSLFTWCVTVLGLPEDAAYKRITAARAARRFPVLLERLAQGRLHLSGICLLAPHLDEQNHMDLIAAAEGLSKRQIEQMLADRQPKPDAPTRIRKLPVQRNAGNEGRPAGTGETGPGLFAGSEGTNKGDAPQAAPEPCADEGLAPGRAAEPCPEEGLAPGRAAEPGREGSPRPPQPNSPRARGQVEPLGTERYKVQFTADKNWVDKLREATALLSHRLPSGDMTEVLEQALTALCEKLMKERFAVPPNPVCPAAAQRDEPATPEVMSQTAAEPENTQAGPTQAGPTPQDEPEVPAVPDKGANDVDQALPAMGGSRYIPAAVRRLVVQRDGLRCTFVDKHGRRCEETRFLELHHCLPWAVGGPNTADNLTLRCRCHNGHAAMLDFGPHLPCDRGGLGIHDPHGSSG